MPRVVFDYLIDDGRVGMSCTAKPESSPLVMAIGRVDIHRTCAEMEEFRDSVHEVLTKADEENPGVKWVLLLGYYQYETFKVMQAHNLAGADGTEQLYQVPIICVPSKYRLAVVAANPQDGWSIYAKTFYRANTEMALESMAKAKAAAGAKNKLKELSAPGGD